MKKPMAAAPKKPEETTMPLESATEVSDTEAPATEEPMTQSDKMMAQLESVPLPIREMFEQLQYQVSNMTCIMKELDFVSSILFIKPIWAQLILDWTTEFPDWRWQQTSLRYHQEQGQRDENFRGS